VVLVPFGFNQKAVNDHRKYYYWFAVPDCVRLGSWNVENQVLVRNRPPKRRSARLSGILGSSFLSMLDPGEVNSRGPSYGR